MKPTTYDFTAMIPSNASLLYLQALRVYMLRIEISWNNDIATVTSARVIADTGSVLSTKNQTSYTPTSDYHPATKKYVDDSIASAITTTLGGSF